MADALDARRGGGRGGNPPQGAEPAPSPEGSSEPEGHYADAGTSPMTFNRRVRACAAKSRVSLILTPKNS
jgi:hypothetical protein